LKRKSPEKPAASEAADCTSSPPDRASEDCVVGRGAPQGCLAPEEATRASSATFEQAFAVVESVADLLERGELSLDASLAEFEKGLRSLQLCYEILAKAQKRIEVLSGEVGSVAQGAEGLRWKSGEAHAGLKEVIERVQREEDLPPAD
jgi:exodeoxyribonuclease VII small subunit